MNTAGAMAITAVVLAIVALICAVAAESNGNYWPVVVGWVLFAASAVGFIGAAWLQALS